MFPKQVLWIYVSIFLTLTLCSTRVCSQQKKNGSASASGGSKKSNANKVLAQVEKALSKLTNGITKVEQKMDVGNEKLTKMLNTAFSTTSKGPSTIVNKVIILQTTVTGKVLGGVAFALKNARMEKQSAMVEKLGDSLKVCYNKNKQDVFKTALTSIPYCVSEDTSAMVELSIQDMNAFQVVVLDLEAFVQNLQNCDNNGCYKNQAMSAAGLLRGDVMNWGKTRGKILLTGATLPPKTVQCIGKNTGITTVAELGAIIKGYMKCVAAEAKK